MGDTKHVCGASGFGLGLDDVCPACQEHNAEMAIKRETPAQAFERGRQLGMEQERALWELSRDGQDIEHGYVTMTSADYAAALEAARQFGMEQARRKPLTMGQIVDATMAIDIRPGHFIEVVRAFERAHGIPTPPAGDSDTP